MKGFLLGLGLLLLAGCKAPGYAPISDMAPPKPVTRSKSAAKPVAEARPANTYNGAASTGEVVVQKGDTLFAIAFQNGLDYRDLASWNNLSSPDIIQVGQVLRLTAPNAVSNEVKRAETLPMQVIHSPDATTIKEIPLLTEPKAQRLPYSEANWASVSGKVAEVPKAADAGPANVTPPSVAVAAVSSNQELDNQWRWPANGSLIGRFGEGGGKGVNIAGEKQSPVFSAAAGKVVYSGSGLRGYGKMVIVKHPGEFLTAYAHNNAILVKEGEWVKSGQKIAEMGDTDSDSVILHFEVRQYGKPVDPLKILPERK